MKELLVFFSIILAVQLQPDESERRCVDGDVSLAGGPNEFEGRVELCVNESWAQVCAIGGLGQIPGNVVCNHTANFKRTGFYLDARVRNGSYYNAKDIPPNFVNVVRSNRNCTPRGNFSSCVSAVHNRGCNNQFASAACPATCKAQSVRLTLSEGSQEGLVEICQERARDTFWTGVCEEDMTLAAATVICRQLGFLQANSSVNISSLPTRHRYTYKTVKCVGNESNLTHCELNNVQAETRCNVATVNCQSTVFFDLNQSEATSTQGGVTQESTIHEQTNVTESIVTDSTASSSGPDMLAVITVAVCGFIILLLLITVATLTLTLFTKSRNKIRLKPATVDEAQPSNYMNSSDMTTNLLSTKILSKQVSSQTSSLMVETVNNTSQYSEPRETPVVPIDKCTYPLNVPRVNMKGTSPQSHTFLVQDGDPDLHIYAELSVPIKDSCGQHDYAELEEGSSSYQNDIPAAPFPYELPVEIAKSLASTEEVHNNISTQGVNADAGHGTVHGTVHATSQGIANTDESHQYAELTVRDTFNWYM